MDLSGLIVALGNPGKQYEHTRHNFGWMVLDEILELLGRRGEVVNVAKGPKVPMRLWRAGIGGGDWLLCKPETYMNLSGEAVGALVHFYRLPVETVFVLHDEVDLPLGRLKLKRGGGTAGHNGLKSIAAHLGSQDFVRLRLGVGKPVHGDVADYVLARFRPEEAEVRRKVTEFAAVMSLDYTCRDFNKVMSEVNSFTPGIDNKPGISDER